MSKFFSDFDNAVFNSAGVLLQLNLASSPDESLTINLPLGKSTYSRPSSFEINGFYNNHKTPVSVVESNCISVQSGNHIEYV